MRLNHITSNYKQKSILFSPLLKTPLQKDSILFTIGII